ncbi:MAG: RNA polymerase factor sigma-54 [Burkholderiaceae bacterium]
MKPSLQLKLSQQLALTPQLQQSIRLLQLSTLELNTELEQILADNPLLERLDDPLQDCLRIAPNGGLDSGRGSAAEPEAADGSGAGLDGAAAGPADDAPQQAGDFDGDDGRDGDYGSDWGEGGRNRPDDDGEREYPQLTGNGLTLREHLNEQLAATHSTRRGRALVELLIDALDDDGFLETSLDEVARMLPEELDIEPEELSGALRLLQSFDPPGVAARDLRECLLIQLARREAPPTGDAHQMARTIVEHHLGLLAAKDFVKLRRALRCDDEMLRDAQALIRQLNPRPGAGFAGTQAGYVVPDVIVRRTRNGWTAVLNPDVMPKLRINNMYAQILRKNRGSSSGLSGQLQEARWLIKNVQQRFETILRVTQAIVDRQRSFFSHGAVAMRPLVLREIADTLGLHESTVSRVTSQKYMLTPFGTFELKYFFGSHVATDSGGAASSTAIRALIKQLVAAEDATQPLSDSQIADLLGEQGFVVARRTVAKYRESLRIPPVSQRRTL